MHGGRFKLTTNPVIKSRDTYATEHFIYLCNRAIREQEHKWLNRGKSPKAEYL